MRPRIPFENPGRSFTERVEYGLTAVLVLVVVVAVLQVCGFHPKWLN